MQTANKLLQELKVCRSELKNLRQELLKLKVLQSKDREAIEQRFSLNAGFPIAEHYPSEKATTLDFQNDQYLMTPIGYIKSCFTEKNGTPRQASVCPQSKAYLKINKNLFDKPHWSLQGLAEFSHIWVLFVFHKNNNKKSKAKVHPPRLDGSAVGVFSTRSPHRPNPIGLSLIKIVDIRGDTIYMTGIDLLDGTPVLDIKPYIPSYDSPSPTISDEHSTINCDSFRHENGKDKQCPTLLLKENVERNNDSNIMITSFKKCNPSNVLLENEFDVRTPEWLDNPKTQNLNVSFTHRAESNLNKFHAADHGERCEFCLEFLNNASELKMSIEKVLKNDPRSVYRRDKCSDRLYYCNIDNVHVTCWFDDTIPLAEVLRVQPACRSFVSNKKK